MPRARIRARFFALTMSAGVIAMMSAHSAFATDGTAAETGAAEVAVPGVAVPSATAPGADGRGVAVPARLIYPATARGDVVEPQFGVPVADPYRWLENDVRSDDAVAQWVAAQNRVTNAYLSTLPGRDALAARMTQLFRYDRFGLPVNRGGIISIPAMMARRIRRCSMCVMGWRAQAAR